MNKSSKQIAIGTLIVVAAGSIMATQRVAERSPGHDPTRYYMQTIAAMLSLENLPRLSGKAFVLSVVADGTINRKNRRALARLFSTNDEVFTVHDVDFSLYQRVTPETLRAGMDVSTLTSYAGRRNAHPEYSIRQGGKSDPLFADLSYRDGAWVAFADGRVEWMDREALGLDADDPFDAGDAAKCSLLRALSDR